MTDWRQMAEPSPEDRDAKRRYSTAAMAQSVVPHGVGEEVTRSRSDWRRAAMEWSARTGREKLVLLAVVAVTVLCMTALLAGLAIGSGALVVAGGIGWALLAVCSLGIGVAVELRRGRVGSKRQ
jgi:hypothetical protein